MSGPLLSQSIGRRNDPIAEAVGDPKIFKENLEAIKTQMQEINQDAMNIEHQMENRLKNMTEAMQKKKYMPKTISEEYEEHKQKVKINPQITDQLSEFDRTKEAINKKLGGEFDYLSFMDDLKDIMDEKNVIVKSFRSTALQIPPAAPKNVPKYNFKTATIKKKEAVADDQIPVLKGKNDYKPKIPMSGGGDEEEIQIDEIAPVASGYNGNPNASRTSKPATKTQPVKATAKTNQLRVSKIKITCYREIKRQARIFI